MKLLLVVFLFSFWMLAHASTPIVAGRGMTVTRSDPSLMLSGTKGCTNVVRCYYVELDNGLLVCNVDTSIFNSLKALSFEEYARSKFANAHVCVVQFDTNASKAYIYFTR
jgi:hypothetical protein